jgi:hypothetical protein
MKHVLWEFEGWMNFRGVTRLRTQNIPGSIDALGSLVLQCWVQQISPHYTIRGFAVDVSSKSKITRNFVIHDLLLFSKPTL